jgi:hypothetical protein
MILNTFMHIFQHIFGQGIPNKLQGNMLLLVAAP